ncbi:hypothetical protein ACTTAF_06255 [Rhodobacter capsulatus]|uniref:hypothetical protein n=1 Tax=Rhodobacter capsulatus TaxID=1061 RepID=UPI0003D3316A|nr:hypothetical protein [Rhodobacter capsulatus]ETD85827.1 hypothetical protein U703_02370 [Rhodobacter capsulatus YW1]
MPSEVELRAAVALAVGDRALRMITEQCDHLAFNADLGRLEGVFKSHDDNGPKEFTVRIALTEPAVPFGGRAIVVHMCSEDGWQIEMSVVIPAAALAAAVTGAEVRG